MVKQESDIVFIEKVRKYFKRPRIININDLGIYHYIWSCDTFNRGTHGFSHEVFAKVKVLETYTSLVEVEMIDIDINGSPNQDIINIIRHNFPKYIKYEYVDWITHNT